MDKLETRRNGNSINVFPDEETFQKIYGECLEKNIPPACEAVQNNYHDMNESFNAYLESIQEHMFRYAYQCGFEAALKKDRKRLPVSQTEHKRVQMPLPIRFPVN